MHTPANQQNRAQLADLRLDYRWVLATLLALAVVLGLFGRQDTLQSRVLALLMVGAIAISWSLGQWRDSAGRWALVILTIALVYASAWWYGAIVLALLALPVGLAITMLPRSSGIAAAVGAVGLLYASQSLAAWHLTESETIAVLGSILGTTGLCLLLTRHLRQIGEWSWDTYKDARALLDEAHSRQLATAHTIDDLAHANRQLALANENLAAARRVAERAQRTKSAFVSKVSHEFRTPLNMIIGLTEVMLDTPEIYQSQLPPGLREDLHIVHRNCEHLASLVNDVLDLSQVEAGRFALYREDVDLGDLIDEAVAAVKPLIDKKLLSCKATLEGDLRVYCDATRIRQVVLNLLSNAARFTDSGGVYVTAKRGERTVTVSIRDTGPGIARADVQRIFEPFYQAANGQRQQDGSGLGLAISQQFVEQHGGRLWLESELGQGSTFHFELPTHELLPVAAPAHRWISESWPWIERQTRPEVMLADVTPRIVMLDQTRELAQLLGRYASEIEYVVTESIEEAAEELKRGESQGALINTASPYQVWPLVAALGDQVPDLPIIGCSFAPSREYAFEAGAVDYLIKPIRRDDLERVFDGIDGPLERILVVDDDGDARALFRRMIGLYDEHIEVTEAASGPESLRALEEQPPDLVLLDILMADMDGWQVLEAQKKREQVLADDGRKQSIPVVVVSAQDPRDRPLASPLVMVATGRGLSLQKVMQYSDRLTRLMFEPENSRDQAPPQSPGAEPA